MTVFWKHLRCAECTEDTRKDESRAKLTMTNVDDVYTREPPTELAARAYSDGPLFGRLNTLNGQLGWHALSYLDQLSRLTSRETGLSTD